MKSTFLSLVLAAASIPALAQSAPSMAPMSMHPAPLETVSVSGSGIVRLVPDRVVFTVGVDTRAVAVEDAVSENNRRVAQVLDALKKAGAKKDEIATSNFAIYPQQDYKEGQQPRIIGYQVTNNVTVTRNDPTDAGKLLQAAINAGVNTASGLNFVVSDPAKGQADGLKAAFADARAKAEILATAAGRSVGRALTINEGGGSAPPPPMPYGVMAMQAKVADVGNVPTEQGSQERSFSVSVVFELK